MIIVQWSANSCIWKHSWKRASTDRGGGKQLLWFLPSCVMTIWIIFSVCGGCHSEDTVGLVQMFHLSFYRAKLICAALSSWKKNGFLKGNSLHAYRNRSAPEQVPEQPSLELIRCRIFYRMENLVFIYIWITERNEFGICLGTFRESLTVTIWWHTFKLKYFVHINFSYLRQALGNFVSETADSVHYIAFHLEILEWSFVCLYFNCIH